MKLLEKYIASVPAWKYKKKEKLFLEEYFEAGYKYKDELWSLTNASESQPFYLMVFESGPKCEILITH